MNKTEIFEKGIESLKSVLSKYGFQFYNGPSGNSSGGSFISGYFETKDRKLELHFRFSLGLVTYHFGDMSVGHEDYMKAVEAENKYPGFSDKPKDGFKHLSYDLENFCSAFLQGDKNRFEQIVEKARQNNEKTGFKAIW